MGCSAGIMKHLGLHNITKWQKTITWINFAHIFKKIFGKRHLYIDRDDRQQEYVRRRVAKGSNLAGAKPARESELLPILVESFTSSFNHLHNISVMIKTHVILIAKKLTVVL